VAKYALQLQNISCQRYILLLLFEMMKSDFYLIFI